jgi:enamine deaminase RidA (YjgF/YER057c/UK114 family)
MGRVLELAGMSFGNLVQIAGFLVDIGQLPTYARVRDEFVNTAAPPASTTIGVTSLALPELLVEVNAIAAA